MVAIRFQLGYLIGWNHVTSMMYLFRWSPTAVLWLSCLQTTYAEKWLNLSSPPHTVPHSPPPKFTSRRPEPGLSPPTSLREGEWLVPARRQNRGGLMLACHVLQLLSQSRRRGLTRVMIRMATGDRLNNIQSSV